MPCYIYGPVPSRRLGFSLGVDLLPCKACSFDCVYCQLGVTSRKRIRRFSLGVDLKELKSQLKNKLEKFRRIDYITVSGSGEPTLYRGLGGIIALLKKISGGMPVAVITNSSLIYRKDVQDDLLRADLVVPSLDSARQASFLKIDRPYKNVLVARIIKGLVSFRRRYQGSLWLEVMLIGGVNTSKSELKAISAAVREISPDKVHLNIPVRPHKGVAAVPSEKEIKLARDILGKYARVVSFFSPTQVKAFFGDINKSIYDYLKRRPATSRDLEASFGVGLNRINKYLGALISKGKVVKIRKENKVYYVCKNL